MSKAKRKKQTDKIELSDTFVSIFVVCWVMVFSYIAIFNNSGILAKITVVPVFFLYGLYLIGSAVFQIKELEILKALGRDTFEVERRLRKNPPKLSPLKLVFAGISIAAGILCCIFL